MLLNRYLEATLRKARFEEKAAARDNECSFQPVTNISRRRSLSAPTKGAKSFSEASRLSRYDLLYMDGERKRQRNIDARFDRFQKGTGELVYELNRKWSECERSKQFNPLLQSTQKAELLYRHVFAYPYVSFFFQTPFTSVSLRTSSNPVQTSSRVPGSSLHIDKDEVRSLSNFSVGSDTRSHSSKSHTRRTEALYLEASLRAARKVRVHCIAIKD